MIRHKKSITIDHNPEYASRSGFIAVTRNENGEYFLDAQLCGSGRTDTFTNRESIIRLRDELTQFLEETDGA